MPERVREIDEGVFESMREDAAGLLEGFDRHQLDAIAEFLARSTELLYRRSLLLRTDTLSEVT